MERCAESDVSNSSQSGDLRAGVRRLSWRRTGLMPVVVLVAWALIAVRSFYELAPHLGRAVGAHSDAAIPQLMANAERLTPYHLYLWGQDRFGGWPFIIPWGIRQFTGFGWTTDSIYWWMCVVMACAVWPLVKLGGRWGWFLASGLLLTIVLNPGARATMTDSSCVYAWQFTCFFWAWWFIRQLADQIAPAPTAWKTMLRGPPLRTIGLAATASFLGVWMSPLTVPLLGLVVLGETVRHYPHTIRERVLLGLSLAIPVFGAALGEAFVRAIHRSYAAGQGWWYQSSSFRIDTGYLLQDLTSQWRVLSSERWWLALPMAVLLCGILSLLARRTRSWSEEHGQLTIVATTLICMSLAVFFANSVISWTRANDYHPRYMTPVHFFGTMSLVAGAAALSAYWFKHKPRAAPWGSLLLLAIIWTASNDVVKSPAFPSLDRICAELARRAPGSVLFGSYWGTYVFADATAERPVIPVLREMDFNRNPWTLKDLEASREVIVSHYQNPRFGPPEEPTPYIQESHVLLELNEPRWLTDGEISFSKYRNRTAHAVRGVRVTALGESIEKPCETHPCLSLPDIESNAEAFVVEFPEQKAGRVLIFFGATNKPPAELPSFEVEPFLGRRQEGTPQIPDGSGAPPVDLSLITRPPLLIVDFGRHDGPPVSALKVRYASRTSGQQPPKLRAAWVLPAR